MKILPSSAINNPDSVGEILKEMKQAFIKEKISMTKEQSAHSVKIMLASDSAISVAYESYKQAYQFAGFFKRCEVFPIKYEKRLQLWLSTMTYEFGIGGMILVAYYVQFRAKEIGASGLLTLDEAVEDIFPTGIFAKKTVHEFWDKQKVFARPDNLIDYPSACASFMPIERTEPITYKDF